VPPPEFARQLWTASRGWWRDQVRQKGLTGASLQLARELGAFLRDSTPERRRQRYGDMDYDWEYRVNTSAGTVGWRERLLGVFHSPYQATDPALFREMMARLPIDYREFTFVDLGSGKGRALLLASEYPFRRIVGVEILPAFNRAAQQNLRDYRSPTQRCMQIESVCADARDFEFPEEPVVLYLFNPLPERAFSAFLERLERSVADAPRPVWVVYHNPLLESLLAASVFLERAGGTPQYALYRSRTVPPA
jgi:SAM-dependent methyltransferase